MNNALIGHTGYVGSFLKTKLNSNTLLYNSKNIKNIRNSELNTVFFCGLPATKWLINQNPEEDIRNMESIIEHLKTCKISRFVLISTIDVLGESGAYGIHRKMMEEWVVSNYPEHHIIRLPALFGLGLKKNALYDLLTKKEGTRINASDRYQWYFVDDLYDDITYIMSNNTKIINLFSEPISMNDIVTRFFPTHACFIDEKKKIEYNYKWISNKETILKKMASFIAEWNLLSKHGEKLVVSALCWSDDIYAFSVLNRYSIKNVELALTKYVSWSDFEDKRFDESIEFVKNIFEGFNIYSLQSVFYGINCNMFSDTDDFLAHFKLVAKISKKLGIKRIVFGSPLHRKKPDSMTYKQAIESFVNTFKKVSDFFGEDICVCIEHNATDYGCNFLNTVAEVVDVLEMIDRPNVKLNLDTGNALMMDDKYDFDCIKKYIGHIQVSAPYLVSIEYLNNLHDFGDYKYKISLEAKNLEYMLEKDIKKLITLV